MLLSFSMSAQITSPEFNTSPCRKLTLSQMLYLSAVNMAILSVALPRSRTLSVYLKNQYNLLCFRSFNSFSIENIIPAKFRIAKDNYSNYRVARIFYSSSYGVIQKLIKSAQALKYRFSCLLYKLKTFSNFHGSN